MSLNEGLGFRVWGLGFGCGEPSKAVKGLCKTLAHHMNPTRQSLMYHKASFRVLNTILKHHKSLYSQEPSTLNTTCQTPNPKLSPVSTPVAVRLNIAGKTCYGLV